MQKVQMSHYFTLTGGHAYFKVSTYRNIKVFGQYCFYSSTRTVILVQRHRFLSLHNDGFSEQWDSSQYRYNDNTALDTWLEVQKLLGALCLCLLSMLVSRWHSLALCFLFVFWPFSVSLDTLWVSSASVVRSDHSSICVSWRPVSAVDGYPIVIQDVKGIL